MISVLLHEVLTVPTFKHGLFWCLEAVKHNSLHDNVNDFCGRQQYYNLVWRSLSALVSANIANQSLLLKYINIVIFLLYHLYYSTSVA